jgi:hypothetical protein
MCMTDCLEMAGGRLGSALSRFVGGLYHTIACIWYQLNDTRAFHAHPVRPCLLLHLTARTICACITFALASSSPHSPLYRHWRPCTRHEPLVPRSHLVSLLAYPQRMETSAAPPPPSSQPQLPADQQQLLQALQEKMKADGTREQYVRHCNAREFMSMWIPRCSLESGS